MAGERDGVEIVARRGRLVRGALTGWGVLMYYSSSLQCCCWCC